MNEQANTRLVQQAYQRLGVGDLSSFLVLLADNVQWKVPAMANVSFAGTWRGRQHVGEFFHKVAETQEQVEFAPEYFIAQDDIVVVLGHFVNRVKATGKQWRSRSVTQHGWSASSEETDDDNDGESARGGVAPGVADRPQGAAPQGEGAHPGA
jgi:ketosteroid isomerase-like protein